jgi:mitochondrial inner membrane protease subunit 1
MSTLFSRLFRRAPKALPSYATSDHAPTTLFGTLRHGVLLIASFWCTGSLVQHYLITYGYSEGESMVPTIPVSNTISITSPWYRNGKGLKVGDLVHAKNPLQAHNMVGKRVIGMPGDYVLRDESDSPTAGGATLAGIYTAKERKEPVMVQVPEGHVWLAGDNMSRSRDSRFYGPVPVATVESKVLFNGDGLLTWTSFRDEQLKRAEEPGQKIAEMRERLPRDVD